MRVVIPALPQYVFMVWYIVIIIITVVVVVVVVTELT
jgi:hypothetical protein